MRVLIDVSRPETIPCTIKDAIIGYVKSLPNRAIEEIESYDRNIQYKNDVICAVERYLNPTKAESLYQEIKKDLSDCDLDLFHATRVLCEDDIKINRLPAGEKASVSSPAKPVELTEEDKKAARDRAIARLAEEQYQTLRKKNVRKKADDNVQQMSLF